MAKKKEEVVEKKETKKKEEVKVVSIETTVADSSIPDSKQRHLRV